MRAIFASRSRFQLPLHEAVRIRAAMDEPSRVPKQANRWSRTQRQPVVANKAIANFEKCDPD
jgi:hypothetical protein